MNRENLTRSLMHVLLIEDNPNDARLIRSLVKEGSDSSMDLNHVGCLSDARKIITLIHVDTVLLGLNHLPNDAALDTLSQARRMDASVPIIILASLQDETLDDEMIHNGAQDCLIKGQFDYRQLRQSIHYAIARKRASSGKHLLTANGALLPICASCKKIRNGHDCWEDVEQYIQEHSEADLTHGLCPECIRRLYPELFPDKQNEKEGVAVSNGQIGRVSSQVIGLERRGRLIS